MCGEDGIEILGVWRGWNFLLGERGGLVSGGYGRGWNYKDGDWDGMYIIDEWKDGVQINGLRVI